MARMIPFSPAEDSPPGEKDVFSMLSHGPNSWTVVHSLDLAPWNRDRRTEIDFVVIIPDAGVLCIEVKSHQSISFYDDRWHPESIKKAPFKQAADGCNTLFRALREHASYVSDIPFVHCCIFPNANFDVGLTVSVRRDELLDRRVFRGFPTALDFCADLKRRFIALAKADHLRLLESAIPPLRVDNMIELCLPVQKNRPGASEQILLRHVEADSLLRSQQRPILELAQHNDRLLVTGGAGTGKTFIALELAKRMAEQGKRVALVTFNGMIGAWLREQVSAPQKYPTLVVDSANRLLVRLLDVRVPANADEKFWSTVPELVEERLTDPEFSQDTMFDYLIVDEAQDILARPALWNCLLALLSGGLLKGQFALFGDVEHQVLAAESELKATLERLKQLTALTCVRLTENCRNTSRVGGAALLLSGLPSDLYSGYLRGGGALDDVSVQTFETSAEESTLLRKLLDDLKSRGYSRADISLLSFCAAERSLARRLVIQGVNLRPARSAEREIGYATIHSFKGMENKVVVVTDLDLSMAELSRSLFYTALTRATSLVRVVCSKTDGVVLKHWITGHKS